MNAMTGNHSGMSHTAWALALLLSVAFHAALAMAFQDRRPGSADAMAGPPITVSGSLAGILGSVAETAVPVQPTEYGQSEVKPTQAEAGPVQVNTAAAAKPVPALTAETATATPVAPAAATDLVPTERLIASPADPVHVETKPTAKVDPARRRTPTDSKTSREQTPARRTEKAERSPTKRSRTSSRAGSDRAGAAGTKRGGKEGRSRASPGAVANYGARVRSRILSNRPAAARSGKVVITFGISLAGRLRYARISRSSGRPGLDAAALSAVRRSAPFPRPPAGANPSQLSFSIPFSFR